MGMGDEILVVKKEDLFQNASFQGFVTKEQMDFIPTILSHYEYKTRTEELENDPSYQQIISYIWIINPKTKQVFTYRRASKKEDYSEVRLMKKWSCGIGGHIDKIDGKVGRDGDPIESVMMRELMEEIKMGEYPRPKIVGFINLDGGVEDVHFGVVAIIETFDNVEKGDNEMEHGQFYSTGHLYTLGEFEQILNDPNSDVERWTKVSWPFVKDYLSKL